MPSFSFLSVSVFVSIRCRRLARPLDRFARLDKTSKSVKVLPLGHRRASRSSAFYRNEGRPGMRGFLGLIRISVVLLLTLRILASPLAMRPESPRTQKNQRLVARVCAWPALRPQRSISALSFAPRPRCNGPDHCQDRYHAFGPQTVLSSDGEILSRLNGPVSQGSHSKQTSVCLRC